MKLTTQCFCFAAVCLLCAAVSCCRVYEWPATVIGGECRQEVVLTFDTGLPKWEHSINRSESEPAVSSWTMLTRGTMRHTVRICPVVDGKLDSESAETLRFTEDLSNCASYDSSFTLQLAPGDYRILVWSDFYESETSGPLYEVGDISRITLSEGPHVANSDYFDAFRGWTDIHVEETSGEPLPAVYVTMARPLAKFELVADDVAEFVKLESARIAELRGRAAGGFSLDNYTVVITYVGYMPNTYNLLTDRPVDSATGVSFTSSLREIEGGEVSLGFDYVFVKDDTYQSVTVQMAIYDDTDGSRITQTGNLRIPLQRSIHTIVRGSFLLMNSSGGIGIDSDFDGEHNRDVDFTF